MLTHAPMALLFNRTAISELEEMDMSWVRLKPHGARLRGFRAGGEDVDRISLPGCAVQNGLAVRRKAGGANAAAAKGELTIKWWFERSGSEE
jgi:hypothetical protein